METDLYKIRSTKACFRAAYDLYCSNLRTLFKNTWLPVLVLSAIACLSHLMMWNESARTLSEAEPTSSPVEYIAESIGLSVMCVVGFIWAYSCVFSLLSGRSRKAIWPRLLRATLINFGTFFVLILITICLGMIPIFLVANKTAPIPESTLMTSGAIIIGMYFVWAIILIPTIYSTMKYVMEPEQKAGSILGSSYRQGWRHWGFLFICLLLACIIYWLALSIVATPELILFLANYTNEAGKLMGDVSGLPPYFGFAGYLISLPCVFVWNYLTIWITMVFYYVYGSIEAKKRATTQTTQP